MKSAMPASSEWTKVIGGAALGVVAMYMFDPDRGRRRRAIVGDKAYSIVSDARQALGAAGRDAAHRIEGLRARARHLLTDAPVPDDLQLIERVRARIGRLVSHPHAIQVGANHGRVTLSGPVLAHEVTRLCDAIRSVWGVTSVENRLVVYDSSESISSLQGGGAERTHRAFERWTPAAQAAAIMGGAAMTICGLRASSIAGVALVGAGVALIVRGAANRPLVRLAQREEGRARPALRLASTSDAPGSSAEAAAPESA
ncbi:MAG TPA: BON domain-containing protein [Casimicrobiaceae bacterium]|nr:BON domain-containing protein [Casimicrobiaceae bacterium]